MQVTIHESKQETYRTLRDLEPGDTFCMRGNTARLQFIADTTNSNGKLEDTLRHSHRILCLNVGRGKFFLAREDQEVIQVQKNKSTTLQWEDE